ncbi:MAG: hypothetical protein KJ893_08420 [Candidatus Omnitrophica bacterium]|nr:hypothetical protein [Candidatus Omnitrophota bacterium]MBU4478874.1 hypothetical protein [Candidatus Omnitrophota bacterium]MCG2702972.1 hypothetical protein [Candidatus Omnitrophota bacterium]
MTTIPQSTVQDNELLACYIIGEEDIVLNEGQVKGDVFVPTPNPQREKRLEKSVIRFGDRLLAQMHIAGKTWANSIKKPKPYIGLAKLLAIDVRKVFDLDIEHTPRKWENLHSDIVKWRLDEPYYRIQAELIARKSSFSHI